MAVVPWVGVKRIAVVPVLNRQVDQEPPDDWEYQVQARLFYDPQPPDGVDRSFQHYLQALSYGRALIEGEVFPRVWADDAEVNIPAMNSLPSGHGYTDLLAVLPHGFGEHRGGHAFGGVPAVNGITGWARVAMFNEPVLVTRQAIGVWGQELFHLLCGLWDHPGLPQYDVMDGDGARASTHASATTKRLFGWLPSAFVEHAEGRLDVDLHAIGLAHPPPAARVSAVQIPSRRTAGHHILEARLRTDPFDAGISAEAVLVYEVQDSVKVTLKARLLTGQSHSDPDEGLQVKVTSMLSGGFAVSIDRGPDPWVPGRLLRYVDASQSGGGDVSNPTVIGLGGWQDFLWLFTNGGNVLYAVDPQGRLLRYVDASQSGGGDVSSPAVIGQGGWQQFRFVFSGLNDVIYAVDQTGRLLRYVDASQSGGGDVSSPAVIGQGGWQQFRALFSGGNDVIYAVDQAGQLLRYVDASQTGGGDVSSPQVIGQGGWQQFRALCSGGNNVIYAVDQAGQLLRYVDASQSGGGDVSSPQVIGQGGWQQFKFLTASAGNVVYAVTG